MALEGNQVFVYIEEAKSKITGKGIDNPLTVKSWQPYINKADLIVFDMVGMGTIADLLRKKGKLVIGGSRIADKIELDRTLGMELTNQYTDAESSEFKEFKNIQEGIRFLQKNKDPFVFKPLNNKLNKWTYVPKETNDDLIDFMQNFRKLHGNNNEFVLQKKVDGTEISTEGVWNGNDFIGFNHTIEVKRFMEGNKGQQTGCAGNIVWTMEESDEIVKSTLEQLTDYLRKEKYSPGCVDINLIVDDNNLWFLEYTARYGYAAIQAMLALYDGTASDFMYGVASGKLKELKYKDNYSIAVRLSMPPYPQELTPNQQKELNNIKAIEYPEKYKNDIWLSDVMFRDKNTPVMAGTDGVVCDVTAIGKTIEECRDKVYKIIDDIKIPRDIQYRADIGDGWEKNIKELKDNGWI